MRIHFVSHINGDTKEYMKLIREIFKHVRDNREFNIIFVSNEEIQEINKKEGDRDYYRIAALYQENERRRKQEYKNQKILIFMLNKQEPLLLIAEK